MIQGTFLTAVPSRALTDKRLTSDETRILCQIYMLLNQQGFCQATNTYFANLNDVTERTIRRWLKSLQDKNYIKIEYIENNGKKNQGNNAII